jgi:hypothetical protein
MSMACHDDKGKNIEGCKIIAGGTTLFDPRNKAMTIHQAFDRVKPVMTVDQYRRAREWANKHARHDYSWTGVVLMGFGAGVDVPKKDACKAISIIETEKSVIEKGIKMLGLTKKDVNKRLAGNDTGLVAGWIVPVSRVNRIDEELSFMEKKLTARGSWPC